MAAVCASAHRALHEFRQRLVNVLLIKQSLVDAPISSRIPPHHLGPTPTAFLSPCHHIPAFKQTSLLCVVGFFHGLTGPPPRCYDRLSNL